MNEALPFLNDDELEQLQNFAGQQFSLKELAIIIGKEENAFIRQYSLLGSPTQIAVDRGRLIQQAAIRKSIIEQAINGSSPAQSLSVELIKQMHVKDA